MGNLNKLKKGLEKYYTDVLEIAFTNIVDHIEISAIARNADKTNLILLLELVMGAIVNCPAKEAYISRILTLDEHIQAELMIFIQKILKKIQKRPYFAQEGNEGRGDFQLKQENRTLKLQLEEFQNSLEEIAQKQYEILNERDIARKQLKDMELELDKKAVKRFPGDLNINQLEAQVNQKESIIQELKSQNSEQKRQFTNEISILRDELDVANEKVLQLSIAETTLEVYKKKLEDANTLRLKVSELEKENKNYRDRMNEYDQEITDVDTIKQTMRYFKEQHTIEKERAVSATIKLETKEKELKEAQRSRDEMQQKKQFLDGKVKELQFELEGLRYRQDSGRGDEEFSLQKNLISEYEEQIAKLELDNKRLRSQAGSESIISEINNQLDRVLIEKKNSEEKLNTEKRENVELKREVEVLKKEVNRLKEELSNRISELSSDLNNSNESCNKLQNKLAQIEKEKIQLEHVQAENERMKNDKESHLQEMKSLFKEKDEIQQKLIESREENHRLQTVITQKDTMLKAADIEREKVENKLKAAAESERIALSELQVLKSKTGVSDSNADKIKFLELERDLMKLNNEISNLKLTLREKDDQLVLSNQEKIRKENELREILALKEEELKSRHNEELDSYKKEIGERMSEIAYLQKNKEEMTNTWNKEMKLMSIVIHEVGMEIIRSNRAIKDDKSWLNSKRVGKPNS